MSTSFRFLLLFCLTTLLCPLVWPTNLAMAQANGPTCDTYTNKITANGLGSNSVNGVYAAGSTVYVATDGG